MSQESRHETQTTDRQTPATRAADGTHPPALPIAEAAPVDRQTALVAALMRAGTLVLSPEEAAALAAPFPDSQIGVRQIRGRQERYISHIHISGRLTDALGAGQWCLVRLREWYDQDTHTIYGSYALVVRGVWVGDTVSGWQYHPDNAAMDYADALESARGRALARIAAKSSLCCGAQVWSPDNDAPRPVSQPPKPKPQSQPPSVPPPTPKRVAELIFQGEQHAAGGLTRLAAWWETLTRAEREAVVGHKPGWKQQAAAADAVYEQAAQTDWVDTQG